MVKRNLETDSDDDGSATPTPAHKTVFVDTTLDTHLVTIVSDDETVADFKKKIMLEHPQCFPKIGEIEIHALKVKQKGYFYHLSDSMLVKSAFAGAKKNWFLSADASRLNDHNDNLNSCEPDAGNQLALLCINYPPDDRNDLPTGCPSNGFSLIDEPLMSQTISIHNAKMRVADAGQSGAIYSYKKVSNDLEMEVKHITDEHCKNSSSAANKENYGDEVCHPVFKENYASSLSCSKDVSHPEGVGTAKSSGNAGREKSNDTTVGNKNVSEEPRKNDKSKNTVGVVQCNISLEEASQSGLRTRKKQKIESNEVSGTPLKQNKGLVSNYGEETSKPETKIPENSKDDKQKSENATLDGISAKLPEDIHLMNSSSGGKTKKKRRDKTSTPHDQIISSVPSSLHSVGVLSCQENGEINPKDLGRISVATYISGEGDQDATLYKHLAVSRKEKQCEPLQEVVEGNKAPSSIGNYMNEADIRTVGDKYASKLAALAEVKGTKKLMKHCATDVKGTSSVSARDPDNLKKDAMHSGHENIVPDDHNFEKDQTDKIEEERELSQNHDPEVLLSERCKPLILGEVDVNVKEANISAKLSDANIVMETGSSVARKRKRMNMKMSARVDQVISDLEHSNNPVDDISSIVPYSAFNGCLDNEAKKKESISSQSERTQVPEPNKLESSFVVADGRGDDVSGNDAEPLLLTQINENKENAGNVDEILRKKSKKYRRSATKTLPDLPIKERGNEVEPMQLNETSRTQENAENVDEEVRKETKRNKNSTAKSLRDLAIVADGKGDDVNGNDAEPLQQINKNKENVGNVDEISRKKPKKNRSSTTKTLPDLPIKERGNEVEPMQLNETSRTQNYAENVDEEVRNETERNKNSTAKSLRDLPMVADGKGDDVSGNDAEPLPLTQMNENKENAGNVDGISRKKSKKNRSSTTKTLPDFPIKEPGNEVEPMQLNETSRTQENAENLDEEVRKETERNKNSTAKSLRDLPMVADEKGDDVSGNDAEPLPLTQMNENKENPRNVDEILRKKPKKNRSSTKTLPDLPIKERGNEVEPMLLNETSRTQENAENVNEKVRKNTNRNKNSTVKSLRDLPMVADGKGDDVNGNDAEPLKQINENKENAGNVDGIPRKKPKKNQSSTTKTLPDLPIKERGNEVEPMQLSETSRTQENAENVDEEVRKETESNKNSTAKNLPMVAEEKSDDVSGNDAEPLPLTQMNENKENAGNMVEILRKKLKKNQSSTTKTLPDLSIKERGNEVQPMQLNETIRTLESEETVDEEVRKETKRNKNSTAKSLRDLPMKKQPVGVKELTSPNDRIGAEDTPSKTKKRTRSVNTSVVNQLTGTDLGLERDADTECASFNPQLPPSEKLEGDSVRRPIEANVDDNALENCSMAGANNQMSDSKCKGDAINFKEYFVSAKNQHEVALEVLVDKVNEAKRSDKEVKAKKSIKKPVACGGTLPDPKNPLKSHENLGSEKKLKGGISSSIQLQGSLSKETCSKVMLHHKNKSSKVSGNEENGEFSTASISSSESSKRSVRNKKHYKHQSSLDRRHATTAEASHKNTGEVREKRLLATPGAIFRDESSDSSEDEKGPGNSDASTRTPSNNSSSSGYSDGETQSSLDSLQNGSHSVKGKKGGGKKNIKPA
ncbi:uncharacterized protein LOC132304218 isoform X2 [Cornus florida]|nr:uncharacterized protein LOC132304218 isoform X2 [Cornus florida]